MILWKVSNYLINNFGVIRTERLQIIFTVFRPAQKDKSRDIVSFYCTKRVWLHVREFDFVRIK